MILSSLIFSVYSHLQLFVIPLSLKLVSVTCKIVFTIVFVPSAVPWHATSVLRIKPTGTLYSKADHKWIWATLFFKFSMCNSSPVEKMIIQQKKKSLTHKNVQIDTVPSPGIIMESAKKVYRNSLPVCWGRNGGKECGGDCCGFEKKVTSSLPWQLITTCYIMLYNDRFHFILKVIVNG